MYPQFIMGVLTQVKNGDEQFWKQKFHAANGNAQHALMNDPVVSFLRGGNSDFFLFSSLVPNVFPKSSHQVHIKFPKGSQILKVFPDGFLKMFPIAPGFYPIWFAQSSTPLCITKKGQGQGCTFVSIFQLGVQRGASIGGMANNPKKLLMRQSLWLLKNKNKKVMRAPMI